MTKKIFRSIFLVAFIVLAACLVLITGALYSYFASEQSDQLAMQARLAAQAVEDEGLDYFDGLATGDLRLTWIAADGSVLYDTDADADLMENHSTREEFTEALSTGHGESSRYSSTLSEETLYQAVLLSDGTVLRASASHRTVFALVFGMLLPLILIMAAAVLLASYLASRLSKRIVGPLNAIDLDDPLSNDVYDELSPLLTRVEQQKEQIASQIEELNRRREEFSAVTDNMSEGLILLDHEGMILSINPSAARIFSAGSDCIGNDILTLDRSPELRALMESADAGRHGETEAPRGAPPPRIHRERLPRAENAAALHHGRGGAAAGRPCEKGGPTALPRPHPLGGGAPCGARRRRYRPLPHGRGRELPA